MAKAVGGDAGGGGGGIRLAEGLDLLTSGEDDAGVFDAEGGALPKCGKASGHAKGDLLRRGLDGGDFCGGFSEE
jgi:hypothetical protein